MILSVFLFIHPMGSLGSILGSESVARFVFLFSIQSLPTWKYFWRFAATFECKRALAKCEQNINYHINHLQKRHSYELRPKKKPSALQVLLPTQTPATLKLTIKPQVLDCVTC